MTTVEPSPAPRRPWWRRVLAGLFVVVLLGAVGIALWRQDWAEVARVVRPAAVPVLLAAVLANAAGLYLAMLSWRAVLVDGDTHVGLADSSRIFFLGMITKLVPGRIWAVLTHIRYGRAAGVGAARMVAVYAVSIPVGLLTGATVGLVVAPSILGGNGWLLVAPALVVAVVLARPELVNRLAALMLRVARREPVDRVASPSALRSSLTLSLVSWVVSGLHLWPVAVLLGAAPLPALAACVGGFAVAMAVSSLVFVVPDGLGAREVLLLLPLAAVLPWPTAALAVVLSRVVVLVSELLAAAVAVLAARPADRARATVTVSATT